MFGMVRILWISLRRPDGHPAWCHAGGRGLVWVQCSGPVVVLYIYNYSYIFLIIQGKWQQNVTDRLAAEWFPASNLHSERLPVAGAAPADCPDFPGELHGTHRPPSHRGSNCLQDPASMRDVVSTCFNMLHVSKSLSHTAIIDSFQFILLCGCYTVSIRCSRYAVGCSSFGPVILVQEDSVELDSAAEAGPQPNRPTETSCHLLVPSHIKR